MNHRLISFTQIIIIFLGLTIISCSILLTIYNSHQILKQFNIEGPLRLYSNKILIVPTDYQKTIINIPAGYVLNIDGKAIPVFGEQECNNNLGLLYPSIESKSTKDCISILPTTKELVAYLIINKEITKEIWSVTQEDNKGTRKITIKRPNGEMVLPFSFKF